MKNFKRAYQIERTMKVEIRLWKIEKIASGSEKKFWELFKVSIDFAVGFW